MIQVIGVMGGFYILTRMIQILETGETKAIKGFAAVGVLVTIVCMILLFTLGTEIMKYMQ